MVGSGMGAISALSWTLLAAGGHVVIDRVLYGNTFALFTKGLTRFGVRVSVALGRNRASAAIVDQESAPAAW